MRAGAEGGGVDEPGEEGRGVVAEGEGNEAVGSIAGWGRRQALSEAAMSMSNGK